MKSFIFRLQIVDSSSETRRHLQWIPSTILKLNGSYVLEKFTTTSLKYLPPNIRPL
uniref:Uncharacterized protein n=1 Tax=Lepeophtheirus salmonis TaxID=72036 RepID=A0A0K2TPV2_LEPSM